MAQPKSKNDTADLTREIGGKEYGIRYMEADKVLAHAGKVFSLLGGSLGGMDMGKAASSFASNLGRVGFFEVLKDCFENTTVEGRSLGRNDFWKDHFRGKARDLVGVIAFMLEAQFADFFGEMLSRAADAAPKLKESPLFKDLFQASSDQTT